VPSGKCAGGTHLSSTTNRCVADRSNQSHGPVFTVSNTAPQAASTGSLPFTGYVVLSVTGLGLLLLTGGLLVRRLARPRHTDAP
jgi:hypothetical protein